MCLAACVSARASELGRRETEARSLADYLRNRARYQLTQRGELVHRHVEDLLGHSESAREVSSEMLGGILAGLTSLARHDAQSINRAEPEELAREIGTIFAQFDRLVHSTREFYAYLTQVLTRYDLDRGMTVEEYESVLGELPLKGAPVESPWDPELAAAMRRRGLAVHEEAVLAGLVDSLD